AGEAEKRVFDFSDFGPVDVDVGDGRTWAEFSDFTGGAVVEAGADREHEVGFVEEETGGLRAVHAEHAHKERIIGGNGAEGHQRGNDGRGEPVREFAGEFRGTGGDDATAEVENRAAG